MAKKKGEGHHGGAWKVAYADFVTAMMALFMVLWIIGQNPKVIQATADYFKDPVAYEHEVLMGQKNVTGEGAAGDDGTGLSKISKEAFKELAQSISKSLNLEKSNEKNPIDVFVTADGVQILIYDLPEKQIFQKGEALLTPLGDLLLRSLAWTLDKHHGYLDVTLFDPQLQNLNQNNHLQKRYREQSNAADNNDWVQSQQRLNAVFEKLIYHGFTLNKLQKIQVNTQKPELAKYEVRMIDLSLHINTLTLKSK